MGGMVGLGMHFKAVVIDGVLALLGVQGTEAAEACDLKGETGTGFSVLKTLPSYHGLFTTGARTVVAELDYVILLDVGDDAVC